MFLAQRLELALVAQRIELLGSAITRVSHFLGNARHFIQVELMHARKHAIDSLLTATFAQILYVCRACIPRFIGKAFRRRCLGRKIIGNHHVIALSLRVFHQFARANWLSAQNKQLMRHSSTPSRNLFASCLATARIRTKSALPARDAHSAPLRARPCANLARTFARDFALLFWQVTHPIKVLLRNLGVVDGRAVPIVAHETSATRHRASSRTFPIKRKTHQVDKHLAIR